MNSLYMELVLIVRHLFHRCKLVHADLSEYNILYHQNHLYIIDVSQSVEHDHPSAFDFLRNDIKNVEDFFGKLGVQCLGLRRCFEFVTRARLIPESQQELPATTEEEIDVLEGEILSRWMEEQGNEVQDGETTHEDSVFLRSFIPRTLNEVFDPERDVEKMIKGEDDEFIYADTIGIIKPTSALVLDGENQGIGGKPTEQKTITAPQTSTPSSKVQFGVAVVGPAEDRVDQGNVNTSTTEAKTLDGGWDGCNQTQDENGSDEEGEGEEGSEEGSSDEMDQQNQEGWVEKKPKGHRHEDRETKKVRCSSTSP